MCQKSVRHVTILPGKNYHHFLEPMRLNKLKYFDSSHLANGGVEMLPGYKVRVPKPVILSLSSFTSLHNCTLWDLFLMIVSKMWLGYFHGDWAHHIGFYIMSLKEALGNLNKITGFTFQKNQMTSTPAVSNRKLVVPTLMG